MSSRISRVDYSNIISFFKHSQINYNFFHTNTYFIYNKMVKKMSPRGRFNLEQRLAAYEVRLTIASLRATSVLQKIRRLLSERSAVTDGYSSLSKERRAELENAISTGTFRHEKLCCLLIKQLEDSSEDLGTSFEVYLRTYRRLFSTYPSCEESQETT
jgi:cell division protein FtsB